MVTSFHGRALSLAVLTAGFLSFAAASPAAAGPSFSCNGALNSTERVICANAGLSALDREMANGFQLAVDNITSEAVGGTEADVRKFRKEQKAFLRRRDGCGSNGACIAAAYRARLVVLDDMNQPE